ncbi:MAG TPA: hypothetical protein VKK79_16025, partial [Candidatus Lokiarchaeia archaeon]|nr:hypothetical protein [Candidatus Lokiarchaeia archaeon]
MALFQHGSAAFGAYLGSLIALFFLLPPSPRVIMQVPDINLNLGFLVDFFGGWVYRGDGGQNAIFLAVLCLILLGTSFLCSPSKNAGIAGLVTFLGEFF